MVIRPAYKVEVFFLVVCQPVDGAIKEWLDKMAKDDGCVCVELL